MEKLPGSCLEVPRPLAKVGFERHARQHRHFVRSVVSPADGLGHGQQTHQKGGGEHRDTRMILRLAKL